MMPASMQLPLAGRRLWVTRPSAQAGYLIAALSNQGAEVNTLPLLLIIPPTDPCELHAALARLTDFDLAIAISPSALDHVFAALKTHWPSNLPIAVVGPGSAARARELGVAHVICPASQFDGAGLLADAKLQQLQPKNVVLFRGNGGRDILPAGLRAMGANVTLVTAYQRLAPQLNAEQISHLLDGQCDGVVISSSEAAQHLYKLAGGEALQQLQCINYFVPHPSIADALRALGAQNIVQTEAGDEGITRSICRYFAPASTSKV